MALTTDEQALFDEALAILPKSFRIPRQFEELGMMAKVNGASLAVLRDWLSGQTKIKLADGPTGTTPDWLGALAIDRGTQRQDGESNQALRDRLRLFEKGITRPILLAAVQSMLTTYGVAGTAYMAELPRDGAFFGTAGSMTGTGGIFTGPTSSVMSFKPNVAFAVPPFKNPLSQFDSDGGITGPKAPLNGRVRSYKITFSGATNSGNNGTFATTGLSGDFVTYANGSGVAISPDNAVSWSVGQYDINGNLLSGFKHAFLSRGDRLNRNGAEIVVMLPYGTSEQVKQSITEMLRLKKGGGVVLRVERRLNP